jgi:hypothetical protein
MFGQGFLVQLLGKPVQHTRGPAPGHQGYSRATGGGTTAPRTRAKEGVRAGRVAVGKGGEQKTEGKEGNGRQVLGYERKWGEGGEWGVPPAHVRRPAVLVLPVVVPCPDLGGRGVEHCHVGLHILLGVLAVLDPRLLVPATPLVVLDELIHALRVGIVVLLDAGKERGQHSAVWDRERGRGGTSATDCRRATHGHCPFGASHARKSSPPPPPPTHPPS